jgi:hypothetical protein
MLTWTQGQNAWHAAGYRIELVAPYRWILVDDSEQSPQVSVAQQPLARARTLTECKREAELLVAAQRRAELRRRHLSRLGLMLAAAVLLVGSSSIQNVVVLFALSLLAARSLGVILGTVVERSWGASHEVFYQ